MMKSTERTPLLFPFFWIVCVFSWMPFFICCQKNNMKERQYIDMKGMNIERMIDSLYMYANRHDSIAFVKLEEICYSYISKTEKTNPIDYANKVSDLVMTNNIFGDREKALSYLNEILPIYERNGGHYMIVSLLAYKASIYLIEGNIAEAIKLYEVVAKKSSEFGPIKYASNLALLGSLYQRVGCWDKAMTTIHHVSNIIEKIPDEFLVADQNKREMGEILFNVSAIHANLGEYKEALRIGEQAYSLLHNALGEEEDKITLSAYKSLWMVSAVNIIRCHFALGHREQAWASSKQLLRVINNDSNDNNMILAIIYNELGFDLLYNQEFTEAYYYLTLSHQSYSAFCGDMHVNTILSLFYKGMGLFYASFYTHENFLDTFRMIDSFRMMAEALNRMEQIGQTQTTEYARLLAELSGVYGIVGKYKDAINLAEESIATMQNILLRIDANYLNTLMTLSYYYYKERRFEELIDVVKVIYQERNEIHNRQLFNLNASEQEFYLSKFLFDDLWYNRLLPEYVSCMKNDEAKCLLYNSLLFRRGLLIRTDHFLKQSLALSPQQELLKQYDELQRKKEYMGNISLSQQQGTGHHIDSQWNALRAQEDEILEQLYSNVEESNYSVVDWKQIQRCLSTKDIAIEFFSYYNPSNVKEYAALVLTSNCNNPILIPICNENKLARLKDLYDYKFIWESIFNITGKVNKVYFSPSGILCKMGIENITNSYNDCIFYRLSTTSEILKPGSRDCNHKIALFGGLDYDAIISNWHNNDVVTLHNNDSQDNYQLRGTIRQRGDFSPLYGSLLETKTINNLAIKLGYKPTCFTNNKGTEEIFKQLSEKPFEIIHVSTHGMYVGIDESQEVRNKQNLTFILLQNQHSYISKEDVALTHSFLVMSGGNRLIHRDTIPLGMDDGILTAQEISHMDLHKTDLVVLSACESGLGDITNEGVIGLQRGFKKAGVNTILMSLDKVDDEATRILMVEFYKNLMSGKTKLQSLKDAQQYLREVENGKFSDPKYWASFIMLDGLN